MKKAALVSLVSMVVMAASLAGCGTVFSGSSQPVTVVGVPADARLSVDGKDVGEKRELTLSTGQDHSVKAEKPGCRDGAATIARSLNGVAIFNLVNPVGWLIDAMTGAVWKLEKSVEVHQQCGPAVAESR